jgi:hypothetical protein
MWRRLKEDWNEHYTDMTCPCRMKGKRQRQMMNTPTPCSKQCCGNWRRWEGASIQERRQFYPHEAFDRGDVKTGD